MLLDHGHQGMQIPTVKEAKGTMDQVRISSVALDGPFPLSEFFVSFKEGWERAILERVWHSQLWRPGKIALQTYYWLTIVEYNTCNGSNKPRIQAEGKAPFLRCADFLNLSLIGRLVYMGGTTMKPPFSKIALMNPHSMKMTS